MKRLADERPQGRQKRRSLGSNQPSAAQQSFSVSGRAPSASKRFDWALLTSESNDRVIAAVVDVHTLAILNVTVTEKRTVSIMFDSIFWAEELRFQPAQGAACTDPSPPECLLHVLGLILCEQHAHTARLTSYPHRFPTNNYCSQCSCRVSPS